MPKKKQMYDVCEMCVINGITYYFTTPHRNIPVAMARYYVRTLKSPQKGGFYMYVKNGLDPLQVLRDRKEKAEKKRQDKMFVRANRELESSYKEHNTPYID